jgi:hypothetical protein
MALVLALWCGLKVVCRRSLLGCSGFALSVSPAAQRAWLLVHSLTL